MIEKIEIAAADDIPILSARTMLETVDGRTFIEQVRNSRSEVAIDWTSVDAWGSALWREAGRTDEEFQACRAGIQRLAQQERAEFGQWLYHRERLTSR